MQCLRLANSPAQFFTHSYTRHQSCSYHPYHDLFQHSERYFGRVLRKSHHRGRRSNPMFFKSRKRPPLSRYSPRVPRFTALKMRQIAKRTQPVIPQRLAPDRPRPDNDPDPFAYKINPEALFPLYSFEEWPLHPGIRPDQFRFGMTADDIVACGVDPTAETEDYQLIQRALSHHNSNGGEIRKQLVANEVKRWQFHSLDCGNEEIKIAIMTLKLRSLKAQTEATSRDKKAAEAFARIYHKRRRLMHALRKNDFGRYKKIMTYLGLRDKFNPSMMSPGVNKYAHYHSKKKPPGGRRGHIY